MKRNKYIYNFINNFIDIKLKRDNIIRYFIFFKIKSIQVKLTFSLTISNFYICDIILGVKFSFYKL